ncbi:MAG TPA: hypothetical protein PKN33_05060 [Phycisphaerae bacterium]|nr:hypothetical protein [Phycisphaerae bacterium]
MAQLEIYQHSGRLGMGLVVVPLLGIIAAVPLGIAYNYADVYIPVGGPVISSVLALVVGALVGLAVSGGALVSKCRNTKFVILIGVVCGFIALYSAWASFTYVLVHRTADEPVDLSLVSVFSRPDLVWKFAADINEEGWFSLRSVTPKGTFLWIIWGCEAIIFLGLAPLTAIGLISERVFCETSEQWCEKKEKVASLCLTEDKQLIDRIADGDINALAELPPHDGSDSPRFEVDIHQSPDELGTRAMRVRVVLLKEDAKDGSDVVSKDVTPFYVLSKEQFERITALAHREPQVESTLES